MRHAAIVEVELAAAGSADRPGRFSDFELMFFGAAAVGLRDELETLRTRIQWRRDHTPDDREAARSILSYVQDELRSYRRARERLEWLHAHELWRTQRLAIGGLWNVLHGEADAKRLQLEVARRPLAVCIGEVKLTDLCTVHGHVDLFWNTMPVAQEPTSGCLRIFDDSRSASGTMFPVYCPGCRGAKRKPRRTAERHARRRTAS